MNTTKYLTVLLAMMVSTFIAGCNNDPKPQKAASSAEVAKSTVANEEMQKLEEMSAKLKKAQDRVADLAADVEELKKVKPASTSQVCQPAAAVSQPRVSKKKTVHRVRKAAKVATSVAVTTTTAVAVVSSSASDNQMHSCSVFHKSSGKLLADFLDASKNPKGIVVTEGSQCRAARRAFVEGLKKRGYFEVEVEDY